MTGQAGEDCRFVVVTRASPPERGEAGCPAERVPSEEVAPAIRVREVEAAQVDNGLCTGSGPAHVGVLGAIADEGATRGLDDAGADGQVLG